MEYVTNLYALFRSELQIFKRQETSQHEHTEKQRKINIKLFEMPVFCMRKTDTATV